MGGLLMATIEHKDLGENQISVDSFIVYSALWDRSAILKFGIVTRLATREERWRGEVQPRPTIRVITVDRKVNHDTGDYEWVLQKKGGEVTLGFTDRVLHVPPYLVPNRVKNLLTDARDRWTCLHRAPSPGCS